MKTLSRLLLILIFALAQIPVLPLLTLTIAQIDNGHRICFSENDGVLTMVLRHESLHKQHLVVLDALICIEANHDQTQDHVINFLHSALPFESFRSSLDKNEIAACEAALTDNEVIAILCDQPLVAKKIPVVSEQTDQTRVPLGLVQTVILV